jgi:hypothetical protein
MFISLLRILIPEKSCLINIRFDSECQFRCRGFYSKSILVYEGLGITRQSSPRKQHHIAQSQPKNRYFKAGLFCAMSTGEYGPDDVYSRSLLVGASNNVSK